MNGKCDLSILWGRWNDRYTQQFNVNNSNYTAHNKSFTLVKSCIGSDIQVISRLNTNSRVCQVFLEGVLVVSPSDSQSVLSVSTFITRMFGVYEGDVSTLIASNIRYHHQFHLLPLSFLQCWLYCL